MNDGYSYSKRDRTHEEQVEYKAIFTDCAEEVKKAEQIAIAGAQALAKHNITEDEVKAVFMHFGPLVLQAANNLYRRLYAHQAKLIADHDDPDNGLYVSPKK